MKKLHLMPLEDRLCCLVYRFGKSAYLQQSSKAVCDKADKLIDQLVRIINEERKTAFKNGKQDPTPENY